MRILCIGGGPAGLYFAISMKRRAPQHEIVVVERNRADDTFGWGVVFSDQTMDNLRANDAPNADQIADSFAHWDVIDIHFKGTLTSSGGHGFSGIGRKRLLHILQERARSARRFAPVRAPRRGPRRLRGRRSAGRGRRRQQSRSRGRRPALQARYRRAPQQVHLARDRARLRCLHFRNHPGLIGPSVCM